MKSATSLSVMIALIPSISVQVAAQVDSGGTASRPTASAPTSQPSTPESWVQVTDKAAFSPRDTADDAVFAGKMWLSNGYYHGNVLRRDLWSSPDGITWSLVNPETPYDGYSEIVVYDQKLWAIKETVWQSTDGEHWKKTADHTPFQPQNYGEVLVYRNKIWQLGKSEVYHTADGRDWTCVTRKAPYGNRSASAIVVLNDRLWLMGGGVGRANDPPEKGYKDLTTFNDVWCSEDGKSWTRVLEHAPWAPRQWFISKVYRNTMWIIGGYDNVNHRNLGDVWYTRDGRTWRHFTSPTSFSPRHEVTCYIFDDSLWVVAGNAWPVQNDIWRLTLPPTWPSHSGRLSDQQ